MPPGQRPPSSAAEPPDERTQAYDFSEDPEFADDGPERRDAGEQPTQQMNAPPRQGGPSDTRQLPPVRDE
jgi:hypothetical protein